MPPSAIYVRFDLTRQAKTFSGQRCPNLHGSRSTEGAFRSRLMGPLLEPSASAEERFRTISTVPRLRSPSSSDEAHCPLALARIVRRPQIRELVQQVAMRSDFVSRHLSVGVYSAEHVEHIVGECPAILRKGCGAARIVGKNVWQQRLRHGDCIVLSVAARMFQFVREDTNKPIILRRLPLEVQLPCLSWEENRLLWPCAPICLNPAFFSLVQGATPKSHLVAPKSRIGQFKHDAAHVLVREEIVASELHFVEQAIRVEKERIAAPTKERTVVSCFRYQRLPTD